jgi:hypothetical protein
MRLAQIAFVVGAMTLCSNARALDAGNVLSSAVKGYEVKDASIEDALSQLVGKAERPFVVGFEQLPSVPLSLMPQPRISIRTAQTTLERF